MKAIVFETYGSTEVLRMRDVEKPLPKDNEVLVRVHAASVNAADWRMLRADPFLVRFYAGLLKPTKFQTLGADIAGRVEAVGKNVHQFQPGDEVFGDVFASGFGGFAEYKCARESELVLKPANISFEEAAAVPLAALTALHGLRDKGRIQAGQKVLINGASGGVGTFAVQLAKYFGAEVTAVCSTGKIDLALSLGADHVIDYTQEDFTRSRRQYDLILAVNGNRSIFDYRGALTPSGAYVMAGGSTGQLFQALLLGPWISLIGKQKMGALTSTPNQKDLLFMKALLESGKIKPIIDRHYPLSEVSKAIRYVEEGHAKGKVAIILECSE
ncbi:NAD(P)-dependent alcohol dehydrogenase [Methylomonas montana]|uniref:NAD(P)-dependent alcohol dehydrogenase n=1 Tax=Methylomonas montana TaxID=3058963 RepID=UPI0026590448|nr:NAD(P)-dependent alcohol dehydrogenase [Methylomonas montana]WKJ90773.1 NAD(P)-dependent alcohol dehydrogenase [Methylomonas montana]